MERAHLIFNEKVIKIKSATLMDIYIYIYSYLIIVPLFPKRNSRGAHVILFSIKHFMSSLSTVVLVMYT